MLLYHGTSERVARLALTEGLVPRFESGVDSVWQAHPSNEHCVYLTSAYAGYFAMNATEGDERWAIIEIDTDLLPDFAGLMPDEDWLEQVTRTQELPEDWGVNGASMKVRTEWFRRNLWRFSHLWEDSVKGLGNCAYEGAIPPEAITRVSFVDPKGNPSMALMASDPCVTLMNYALCRGKYQSLMRWLMGDTVDPAAFLPAGGAAILSERAPLPPELQALASAFHDQTERLRTITADRTGVEVHHAK